MSHKQIQKMVGLAIFTAVVIVLQLLGSFIKVGTFSISLVLIPIVVGAAVYGAGAGACSVWWSPLPVSTALIGAATFCLPRALP